MIIAIDPEIVVRVVGAVTGIPVARLGKNRVVSDTVIRNLAWVAPIPHEDRVGLIFYATVDNLDVRAASDRQTSTGCQLRAFTTRLIADEDAVGEQYCTSVSAVNATTGAACHSVAVDRAVPNCRISSAALQTTAAKRPGLYYWACIVASYNTV